MYFSDLSYFFFQKSIRVCLSIYCFITSIVSIVLEAPDWMRYLSDNRSPDQSCKLAMIAVPGMQRGN